VDFGRQHLIRIYVKQKDREHFMLSGIKKYDYHYPGKKRDAL